MGKMGNCNNTMAGIKSTIHSGYNLKVRKKLNRKCQFNTHPSQTIVIIDGANFFINTGAIQPCNSSETQTNISFLRKSDLYLTAMKKWTLVDNL